MKTETYTIESFELESGTILESLDVAFTAFGTLNEEHSNIIWVFHALSANSDVRDWWSGLFGPESLYKPCEYFIICANIIGSPYGSTRPTNLNFPEFTVRDIVNSQFCLAKALGINKIHTLIGGSLGGSQALEFAFGFEGEVENMVLLACSAKESPWGIAVHEAQRMAIQADETFGTIGKGKKGLKAARAMAMLGYRTSDMFIRTQQDNVNSQKPHNAASYLQYQGEKFVKRFDSVCYFYLSNCLDTHDIGRGRKSIKEALATIKIPSLVIGIDSDLLMPVAFQKELAQNLPVGYFKEIQSSYGHDGFLVEHEKIAQAIREFYKNNEIRVGKKYLIA